MAVTDGFQTPDEKREVEKELLNDKGSSSVTAKNFNRNRERKACRLTKSRLFILIGTISLVMSIAALSVVIADLREKGVAKAKHCMPNVAIFHGKVYNSTISKHGDLAHIECNDGYKVNGSKTIVCLSSGRWNETPVCVRKRCEKFALPNHLTVQLRHLVHEIEEIVVACDNGFLLEGEQTVVCQDNETWSKVPSCKRVNCGYPSEIKNGIILNLTDTKFNNTFHVNCNDGYNLRGDSIVECEADGTWTAPPECIQVSCGTPAIPDHAYIVTLAARSVLFKCKNGFAMTGNANVSCQIDGEWSTYPKCKRTCPLDIKIENGRVINTSGLNFSHTAKIECAEKHKLNGSKTISCLLSGQWNETPICVRKQCAMFQVPPNAYISLQNITTYIDDEVDISCIRGFFITGRKTVTCQENEMWSPLPKCKPVDCGIPKVENGKWTHLTHTTYNSKFRLLCDTGYYLTGSSIVKCEHDGKWTGSSKCKPVSCGYPPTPDNAYKESRGDVQRIVFRSVVSFECKSGFVMNGTNSSVCQSNSKWSTPYPKCVKIKEAPVSKNANVNRMTFGGSSTGTVNKDKSSGGRSTVNKDTSSGGSSSGTANKGNNYVRTSSSGSSSANGRAFLLYILYCVLVFVFSHIAIT